MPVSRPWLLGLLVVTLPFAGCAEDAPVDPAAEASVAELAGPATDDGTTPMPDTVGAMPHLHDYWQGRERVTLFDDVVDASTDWMDSTLVAAAFEREARAGGVWFLLPEGAIVYEGTGALAITATWTDPGITGLGVSFKSAATTEWSPIAPLANGEAFELAVTPEMTDMPHSSTSRWAFHFGPMGSPSASMGSFELVLDIVKMRDIDLFPGHPDHFNGLNEKVLFADAHRTEKAAYATRGAYLLENGDFGEPEFAPNDIVPMATTLLRVSVNITKTEATAGDVTEVRFFYRGADSNQLQPGGSGDLTTGTSFTWDIPVEMVATDSPYATTSQWRFMVEPATSASGVDPTCGGCVDSALEFTAVITAYAVAPEDAAT